MASFAPAYKQGKGLGKGFGQSTQGAVKVDSNVFACFIVIFRDAGKGSARPGGLRKGTGGAKVPLDKNSNPKNMKCND